MPKTGLKEKAMVNSCGLYQGKKISQEIRQDFYLGPKGLLRLRGETNTALSYLAAGMSPLRKKNDDG